MSAADKFVAAVEGAELIPPNRSTSCLLRWPQPTTTTTATTTEPQGTIFNCPSAVSVCQNWKSFISDNRSLAWNWFKSNTFKKRRGLLFFSLPPPLLTVGVDVLLLHPQVHCLRLKQSLHTHTVPEPQDMWPLAVRGNWVGPRGVNNKSSQQCLVQGGEGGGGVTPCDKSWVSYLCFAVAQPST